MVCDLDFMAFRAERLEAGNEVLRGVEVPDAGVKLRPVRSDARCRTVRLRHRIAREIRAGRECQERTRVPDANTIRFAVMMRNGGRVRRNQTGEAIRMRMKRVVRAGRVVAEVAVC